MAIKNTCKTCKHAVNHHGLVDCHTGCLYFNCPCMEFKKLDRCADCDHAAGTHKQLHNCKAFMCKCLRFKK